MQIEYTECCVRMHLCIVAKCIGIEQSMSTGFVDGYGRMIARLIWWLTGRAGMYVSKCSVDIVVDWAAESGGG